MDSISERLKAARMESGYSTATAAAEALGVAAKAIKGADKLAGISVTGEVVEHVKGPKIRIHKFKNKTGYHKRQGHRQKLTVVKVTAIA